MQSYDATLKLLLRTSAGSVLAQAGVSGPVTEWLNAELPDVQTRRLDLFGRLASGRLLHVELQSSNDPLMALRMAEYGLAVYRRLGEWPWQIVLYVGEAEMRMESLLAGPDPANLEYLFRYRLMDFREVDGEALLASSLVEENVLAVLARLADRDAAVRRILGRIAGLGEARRRRVFTQFLILSGLRSLEDTIEEEAGKMPILNDLLTHKVIGPAILRGRAEGLKEGERKGRQEGERKGLQEGERKGLQEGERKGRQEGERTGRQEGERKGRQEMVRRQITKRFGNLPEWVEVRLNGLTGAELDEIALRLLDAPSLDVLFGERG